MATPDAISAPQTQQIPEGFCQFEGRIIPLTDVPERAWNMPVYENGHPTGQTIGDVVREARARQRWESHSPAFPGHFVPFQQ